MLNLKQILVPKVYPQIVRSLLNYDTLLLSIKNKDLHNHIHWQNDLKWNLQGKTILQKGERKTCFISAG